MKKCGVLLLAVGSIAGCPARNDNRVVQERGKNGAEMVADDDILTISKCNTRTGIDGAYKVEIWTKGFIVLSGPLGFGVEITDASQRNLPPRAKLKVTVLAADRKESKLPQRLIDVELKNVSGCRYRERAYTELDKSTEVIRTAGDGTWRAIVDNPLHIGVEVGEFLDCGKYIANVDVEILDGPRFSFSQMAFQVVSSRDPRE
jgi:hypothetical protein